MGRHNRALDTACTGSPSAMPTCGRQAPALSRRLSPVQEGRPGRVWGYPMQLVVAISPMSTRFTTARSRRVSPEARVAHTPSGLSGGVRRPIDCGVLRTVRACTSSRSAVVLTCPPVVR